MTAYADRWFITETVTDQLGDGVRVYDTANNVYEARERNGAGIRIYTEEGETGTSAWQVTVRKPFTGTFSVDDAEDAYTTFWTLGSRLESAYGSDLSMDQDRFMERYDAGRSIRVEDMDTSLFLNHEHGVEFPETSFRRPSVSNSLLYAPSVGAGAEVIALGSIEIGMLYTGGLLATYGASLVPYSAEKVANHRKQKKLQQPDALDDDLYTRINERNRLKACKDRHAPQEVELDPGVYALQQPTLDQEHEERLHELNDQDLDETLETLLDIQFHDYDRLRGVLVTAEEDTYRDAAAFATAATAETPFEAYRAGTDPNVPEKPSVYRDRDLFSELIAETTIDDDYIEPGESHVVSGGVKLIRDALEREETAGAVDEFIAEAYPCALDEIGIELLGGDTE